MTYNELIKKLSPKLRSISYKLKGLPSHIDHDDLFQEAVVFLFNEFNNGRLDDKTDSYILQGCYFHLSNFLRKQRPRVRVLSFDSSGPDGISRESLTSMSQSREDVFEMIHQRMLADSIYNNGLKQREKEMLKLYCEGFTTRQIGESFNISHVGVIKAMRTIRSKCLKHID